MPVVNRLPLGLLSFLGIQNGGRYPDTLLPALAPVLDLGNHYVNTNREYLTGSSAIAALASTTIHTVPSGQWWYCCHASLFTATLGAGQAYGGVLALLDAAGLVTTMLSSSVPAVSGAGAVFVNQARGFWAGPGERLGVYTTHLAAGPVSTGVSLAFARFAM
jgi:hypothetical protein